MSQETALDPSALVIWYDDALLVVNKPAGLPTLVDGYDPQAPFLAGILKTEWDPLWIVHRLDRQTSGVIIFARTAQAHRNLNIQFEKRQAQKIYHALVLGSPAWQEISVTLPLRANGDRKHRTVIDPQRGKTAQTDFTLRENLAGFALVAAQPRTGRTHQIRAHLAAIQHPIIMDLLYAPKQTLQLLPDSDPASPSQNLPFSRLKRLALHALEISFRHPINGQEMRFSAPYPDDFSSFLSYLRLKSNS